MFDSVLETAVGARSRFGTGTAIAVTIHAGLLVFALHERVAPTPPGDEPIWPKVLISPLKAGGGAAAAKPKSAQPAKPKPQPKKNVLALAPKQVEPVAPPEQPDPPALDSSTDVNSQVGEPLSDNPGPGSGPGPGPGDGEPSDDGEPRVFEAGMTRPDWQAAAQRDPIVYSREAREAMVEGGMVVKCVVTTAGRLTNCRVIKAQPFMTEAVLSAMSRWQVDPVTLQGRPIAVNYVFNISLKMPGR